jgi:drug/metabolite transporter (DMT)-like permease
MPSSARLAGFLCALAAPLCWSVGGVVFRTVEAGPWEAIVWRSLGHAVVFPLFLLFHSGTAAFADLRRAPATAVVVAACVASTFILHVLAMMSTTVANVLVVQSTSPLLVAILAWVILGERVEARGWVTLAVPFAGLAIVIGASIGGGSFLGNAFALGVALSSACMVILIRRARALDLRPVSLFGACGAIAIALPQANPLNIATSDMALLFALGVAQMTLGLTFFFAALRLLPAAQVTLIALLEPVLGPIWVWLLMGEEPPATTLLGGTIIIGALAINTALALRGAAKPSAQPA